MKMHYRLISFLFPQLIFLILAHASASNHLSAFVVESGVNEAKPNVLMITVDDMNWDSVGVFGNPISDITPNIDQIANQGVAFDRAYVAASNCAPSRVAVQTGLYPQQSGAIGFFYIDDRATPTIATELKKHGYFTGVINKSTDTNPSPSNEKYWGFRAGFDRVEKYSAKSFGKKSKEFFDIVKSNKQPFYLLVNITDPHKPNFNDPKATKKGADVHVPSRIISESEITIPEFLPDLPAIRKDLRNYFNSVKRADDTLGEIMDSLEKSGFDKNTLVIFFSDHGMPFPFAKSSVYDNGLKTPLVMKWSGKLKPGSRHKQIVSVLDLMPTILDAAGTVMPKGHNYLGKTLLKTTDDLTKYAFGSFDENAQGYPVPMRGVISDEWNYVFNAWSDGKHIIKSAAMNHLTFRTMEKHAPDDPAIKSRIAFYKHRQLEELCHLKTDPHCLINLIDDPAYSKVRDKLQNEMRAQMVKTNDYLLPAFDARYNQAMLRTFMHKQHQTAKYQAKTYKWKRGMNMAGPTKGNKDLYLHTFAN